MDEGQPLPGDSTVGLPAVDLLPRNTSTRPRHPRPRPQADPRHRPRRPRTRPAQTRQHRPSPHDLARLPHLRGRRAVRPDQRRVDQHRRPPALDPGQPGCPRTRRAHHRAELTDTRGGGAVLPGRLGRWHDAAGAGEREVSGPSACSAPGAPHRQHRPPTLDSPADRARCDRPGAGDTRGWTGGPPRRADAGSAHPGVGAARRRLGGRRAKMGRLPLICTLSGDGALVGGAARPVRFP